MDPKLFLAVFTSVFVAEIGDKTQLATMLFASNDAHGKWTVFLAASLALALAAGIGVLAGAALGKFVEPRTLTRIAAVAFVALGVWTWIQT